MTMTIGQAQQIVNSGVNPQEGPVNPDQPDQGGGITPPFGPTQGPSNEFDYAIVPPDFVPLNPWRPGYFYNQRTGEVGRIKQTSGGSTTFETLSQTEAKTFLGDLSAEIAGGQATGDLGTGGAGGGGTGGGGGGSNLGNQQLAENQRQFNLQFPETQREFDIQQALAQQQANAGYLQNRATTGLNLGDLVRGLSNDVYQRALDPGNYPAYLAASAGLPQGAGSPISALIGQGTQIQPPGGSNPLADPRFQGLMDQLYGYAQPQSLSTVQNIAAQHGGTLPPEFYKYTGTTPPAHASGGSQMLNGPVVGVNMTTGQPEFIAGEGGREMVTFTPMHTHDTNGVPMPHQHDYGEQSHEHMGNVIQFANGGAVIAGTGPTQHQLIAAWNAYHPNDQMADVLTPAEGTAVSAGKAIGNLGYAPQYLTDQLMEGRTPTPGSLDEATLMRLPPSIRALLQAQVRSALGGAGLMDYNAELQNQQFAGLNSGRTYTQYQ